MTHGELDPAQHELLQRLAAGEIDAADPAVVAAAAAARFRAALEELRRLQADLDGAAAEEIGWQQLAAAAPPQPDCDDVVSQTVRRLASVDVPRRRPVLALAFAAAAAVLLLLSWWLSSRFDPVVPAHDDRTLGPGGLQLEAPEQGDGGTLTLRWRALPGLRFVVKILEAAATTDAAPLRELETEDRQWVLEADELPATGAALRWEVEALDPSGRVADRASAPLPSRSPR